MVEYCRNGHEWTPENTVWEGVKSGKPRRRCRQCRKDSRARRRGDLGGIGGLSVGPIRVRSDLSLDERVVVERFGNVQQLIDPKCRDRPNAWADYDEEHIPTPEKAAAMCSDCLLLEMCNSAAQVMRHGWGVWGGKVWVFGREYTEGSDDTPIEK